MPKAVKISDELATSAAVFARGFMKQDDPRQPDSEKTSSSKDALIYSKDGVDLTLIRWMLSLTPTERLQTLQQNIQSIMRLRGEKAGS